MTSERLAEIREVMVTYRPVTEPDCQAELLTAAQDLYDLARQGLRREAAVRDLVIELERIVATDQGAIPETEEEIARFNFLIGVDMVLRRLAALLEVPR
jgi:hypothetical protein